jgi:hypothetical protein
MDSRSMAFGHANGQLNGNGGSDGTVPPVELPAAAAGKHHDSCASIRVSRHN